MWGWTPTRWELVSIGRDRADRMWRMDEFRQKGGRRPQRGFMDVVKENMQRVGEKDEDDPLWQPVKGAAERKRGSTLIPGHDLIITFLLLMLHFFLFAFKVSWCCGAGTRRPPQQSNKILLDSRGRYISVCNTLDVFLLSLFKIRITV